MVLSDLDRRCTGLDAAHLCEGPDGLLLPEVRRAFERLQGAAREAGFDLRAASAYRSFERQRQIWNGKLRGARPVLDDADREIDLAALDPRERVLRVLRFSALPGTSRHHWGTDLDVYDAAALPAGHRVGLTLAEVAEDGIFGPLHCWLDERVAAGESFGFYRPYDRDRGGVAPERWHLSFAPAAQAMVTRITASGLRRAWDEAERAQGVTTTADPGADGDFLEARAVIEGSLEDLLERFVRRVASPPPQALAYATT